MGNGKKARPFDQETIKIGYLKGAVVPLIVWVGDCVGLALLISL